MGETSGGSEESHAWNFQHDGDDIKAAAVTAGEMTLAAKMKEAFQADGLFYKAMESMKARMRGPRDFPKRRTARYIRVSNGDAGRESPILVVIVVLLLIIAGGVGVALLKLSSIEKGQLNGRTTGQ